MNILEQVATHLAKQQQRSITEDHNGHNQCAYRGSNGMMCAIGCLIPDEDYDPKMEYSTVSFVVQNFPGGRKVLERTISELDLDSGLAHDVLTSLQDYHDHQFTKDLAKLKRLGNKTEENIAHQLLNIFTARLNEIKEPFQ